MLPTLTARQKEIYDFLLRVIREKGYAPSIPEIGAKFKIASTNGVADHLKALQKKGYIRRVGKRAIEVANAMGKAVLAATREQVTSASDASLLIGSATRAGLAERISRYAETARERSGAR